MSPRRSLDLIIAGAVGGLMTVPAVLLAGQATITNSFTNGSVADADQVNQNFLDLESAVDDNDTRVTDLETAFAALVAGTGIPEPDTFSCVPVDQSYSSSGGTATVVCSVDITLAGRSLVYANLTGHYQAAASSWCLAELLFPGELSYPDPGSPFAQRWSPHHYVNTWTGLTYSRTKVLDAGTHTLAFSVTGNPSTCTLNGAAMHGFAIRVAE